MKAQLNYTPDNLKIFCGFYNSYLYDPDKEFDYNYSEKLSDPDNYKESELDFDTYTTEVTAAAVDILRPYLENDQKIISNCENNGLYSPKAYNYSTDKLNISMNIDLELLKNWCLLDNEYRNGFDKYLKAKYTSRSGFISFVENNVNDYFLESYKEYYDVLIDYYLLVQINKSMYQSKKDFADVVDVLKSTEFLPNEYELLDVAAEIFYNNMIPIEQ